MTPPSLKNLSREEKLRALDLLAERRKRDKLKKPSFEPFVSQRRIFESPALEKYVFCGNGFGKTTMLVNLLWWAATGYNPVTKETYKVPTVIYLVVDDPTKIDAKILPELRKWFHVEEKQLHKDGKPSVSRITWDNGSVCHIITHEVNMLKVEGVEMEWLLLDEPPPRHVFVGLRRGGRMEGRPLKIFAAGTPLYQPWMSTDIYDAWVDGKLKNVECFFGNTDENTHLEEGYKEQFGSFLSEEEKATRFGGAFSNLSGRALAALWQPALHIIPKSELEWRDSWPTVIAMDPHPSKAHVAIKLGCNEWGELVVLAEYAAKKLARDFMEELIALGWFDTRVVDIIYDSLGNTDMTGGEGFKSFGQVINEVLTAHDLGRARATTYEDKCDEDWVERMRENLVVPKQPDNFGRCLPKLRLVSGLAGLERDIRNVQWAQDKRNNVNKPTLDITNKDFLACLKYALATNLHPKKKKEKAYYRTRPAYGVSTAPKRMSWRR